MLKNNVWLNALISLIFIACPSIVGLYFVLREYPHEVIKYYWTWIIAIGLIVYVSLLSFAFIKLEFISIDSINFNIPLALVFSALFVSYPLPFWAMVIIVVAMILSSFPINILVSKYKDKKRIDLKNKLKQ